jgi:PAS domain S-box-containing protein
MVTGDMLHRLAFDNSLQANIITMVSKGKIIAANSAACKLLGYSKKELLTKSRKAIFNINENSFKKMLKQRAAGAHSIALVTAIRKDGRHILCEIKSALFLDTDGGEKAITTISDMSQSNQKQKNIDAKKEKMVAKNIDSAKLKQKNIDTKKQRIVADNIDLAKLKQKSIDTKKEKIVADNIVLAQAKSDARLAENDERIRYITKNSYDVMWEWDIATGEIFVGDSVEEVFGYKLQNNTMSFKDFTRCLLPEEIDAVEKKITKALASGNKSWNDSFMLKRRDGSVASTVSRASIVRDENGKAYHMIGVIHDLSRQKELEEKLEHEIATNVKQSVDYKERFNLIFNSSSDVLYDIDLVTNQIILSDAYEKEFGYRIKDNMTQVEDWANHIHTDDKEAVMQDYFKMLVTDDIEWKYGYRFLRADNSMANVLSSAIVLRNAEGKAYRMLGYMKDISKQRVLEEKLENEIRLKEKRIAEATEEAKETERSDIGKELHDNVNQLLSASRLYLDIARRGGKNREMYLNRSSEYTLTAIEAIRKLTKGLTTDLIKSLGLCEAIDNVVRDTIEAGSIQISCALKSFIEDSVNDKFKLNLFRIVQEQLNNILKHSKATRAIITLSQTKQSIMLTISDNGVGFDTDKPQKGIGLSNIKSRAASYKGIADFVSRPEQGCILTVIFHITDQIRS